MSRWLNLTVLCAIVSTASAQEANVAGRETDDNAVEAKKQEQVLLTRTRYYRLGVKKLSPTVYVVLAKVWAFADAFPEDLLAKIKESPRLEKSTPSRLSQTEDEGDEDSGYIRWIPGEEGRKGAGALLWYVNGKKHRELVVSVDLLVDHTLRRERKLPEDAFGSLRLNVDLEHSKISAVRYGGVKLRDRRAKSPAVDVENTVEVSMTGSLTEESCEYVRGADRLLSDEISTAFGRSWRVGFTNESHHGITLGWLGHEHLRHGLMFIKAAEEGAVDFRYTVSGDAFSLALVRRQLQDDSWPLVLRGTAYVGASEEGAHVFQPVEYMFSKESAR